MSALASKNTLLIVLIILLIFGGCQDKQPDLSPVRYSIPVLDSCENEQDHKYFISKPEIVLAEQKIPLIIVIDPHGDGKFALEQFTRALVDIPAVIIGSAKLKNNNAGFELSLSHLYNDVLVKYPVESRYDYRGWFFRRRQDGLCFRNETQGYGNHYVRSRSRFS